MIGYIPYIRFAELVWGFGLGWTGSVWGIDLCGRGCDGLG